MGEIKNKCLVFVDLDGVLTDFTKKLCETLGKPLDRSFELGNNPKVWKMVDDAGEDFWAEMDWMPDGKELWEELKKYNPIILTSPSRHKSSVLGKKKWLKKNIPGVPFIIEQNKTKYVEPGAILIDDRKKNIDSWNRAGGIGVLHKSRKNTVKILSEINPMKKVCASYVVMKIARSIFGGKFDKDWDEFKKSLKIEDPTERGRFAPEYAKDKNKKPFLMGVDRYKKNLMFNTLGDRFGLMKTLKDKPAGGANRHPQMNLSSLIQLLRSSELKSYTENDLEDLKKQIRYKSLDIFPENHRMRDKNMQIYKLISLVMKNADKEDIQEAANEVNPQSYGKTFKNASDIIKDLLNRLEVMVNEKQ